MAQIWAKLGQKQGFLLFSQVWFIGFLEIPYNQGVNQKITIGAVRLQLGKRALACPNVAGGSGGGGEGALSLLPQVGLLGAEPPRKKFNALNCA